MEYIHKGRLCNTYPNKYNNVCRTYVYKNRVLEITKGNHAASEYNITLAPVVVIRWNANILHTQISSPETAVREFNSLQDFLKWKSNEEFAQRLSLSSILGLASEEKQHGGIPIATDLASMFQKAQENAH